MQTYTHLVAGAALGSLIFPDAPLGVGLCAVGGVVPDLIMVPNFVSDTLQGKVPLAHQPRWLRVGKEISHSTFFWTILLWAGRWFNNPMLMALALGGVSHVVIDMYTHGDLALNQKDHHILWPLPSPHSIGSWDYRYRTGALWPIKPPEQWFLGICTGMLLVWVARYLT